MKKITSTILALTLASSLSSQAAVVVVDGWTLNDNSFTDDANGTFTTSGSWNSTGGGDANDWAGNSLFDSSGSNTEFAEWAFLGLYNNKDYEVIVSWSAPNGNRSSAAEYSVNGGATIPVNQEIVASGGPTLNDGSDDIPFFSLGTFSVTDGTLTVRLDDVIFASGDFVIADSAAIRMVPEPSSTALLGLGGLALMLRRKRS